MSDSPFKEVVIPRDRIAESSFAPNRTGCCCYIGHVAMALGVERRDYSVMKWAWDRFGMDWEYEVTDACFERDEARAIELFAQQNIPVRFVDSLEVANAST